jgi:hypothetical protein
VQFRRQGRGAGGVEFRFPFAHAAALADMKENYKGKLHIKQS